MKVTKTGGIFELSARFWTPKQLQQMMHTLKRSSSRVGPCFDRVAVTIWDPATGFKVVIGGEVLREMDENNSGFRLISSYEAI